MPLNTLMTRTSQCELCSSTEGLNSFELESKNKKGAEAAVLLCEKCHSAISSDDYTDINHWRGLNEAIWSEFTPVKVLSYRVLHALKAEGWAMDLIEQIYLDEEDLDWAKSGVKEETTSGAEAKTVDSNGVQLFEGDSVTLIKDLDVKGAGFTAKRGTLVKNIKLTDNPKHIEGKVNGIGIVLVSAFLKKIVE